MKVSKKRTPGWFLCTLMTIVSIIAYCCHQWPLWRGHGMVLSSQAPRQVRRKKGFYSGFYVVCILMCVYALPGATPAQSKLNLTRWLDSVIHSLTKHNSFVYRGAMREAGFYHQILFSEFLKITSILSQAFAMWGRDCATNGFSCGACFYVGGSGHGSTMFTFQAEWGPF